MLSVLQDKIGVRLPVLVWRVAITSVVDRGGLEKDVEEGCRVLIDTRSAVKQGGSGTSTGYQPHANFVAQQSSNS